MKWIDKVFSKHYLPRAKSIVRVNGIFIRKNFGVPTTRNRLRSRISIPVSIPLYEECTSQDHPSMLHIRRYNARNSLSILYPGIGHPALFAAKNLSYRVCCSSACQRPSVRPSVCLMSIRRARARRARNGNRYS